VGLYGPGPGKDVVMRAPGVVRIYCNVHPQMAAFVIVTPTSLAARVKPDGSFEITGVPAGAYELKVIVTSAAKSVTRSTRLVIE